MKEAVTVSLPFAAPGAGINLDANSDRRQLSFVVPVCSGDNSILRAMIA